MPSITSTGSIPTPAAVQMLRDTLPVGDAHLDRVVQLEQIALGDAMRGRIASALPTLPVSDTAELSSTGRLIDQWLHQAEGQQQPHHVTGSAPLLPTTDVEPSKLSTQLSEKLQQAVEHSGLFYEAHLRQWADGERSLAQIRQEPQNLPTPNATHDASVEPSRWVPLQLETLEQQHFVWQGELQTGQALRWEVNPDRRQAGPKTGAPAQSWQTVLKLELPELGQVNATIRLEAGHVQLQLQAEQTGSAQPLRAGREHLLESLAAAGLTLDAFNVKIDEQGQD